MIGDYESLELLSKRFQAQIIANQKQLNELRAKQFYNMTGDDNKVNFTEIRRKTQDFQRKEKSQLTILAKEMNELLTEKIKSYEEDELFKNNEILQEKILLEELEKEHSNQLSTALKLLSNELYSPLISLIIHVDTLLKKPELSEKQKNHLQNVRQNILSGLNAF
ncbi:MAG: hypothetical protein ACE5GR_02495 [Nitrosopumilus sp.]